MIFDVDEMLSFQDHVKISFMNGRLTLSLFASDGPFGYRSKDLTTISPKLYLNRKFVFRWFLNRFSHFTYFSRLGLVETFNSSQYFHELTLLFSILFILQVKMFLIKVFSIIWVIVFLLILQIMDWNFSYFFLQPKFFYRRRERYSITFFNSLIGCRLLLLTLIVILIRCISIYFSLSAL